MTKPKQVKKKLVQKRKYYHHEWDHDHKGHEGRNGCTSVCKKCGKILISVILMKHPYSPWKTCTVKGVFD
jgi:hypothetical protein